MYSIWQILIADVLHHNTFKIPTTDTMQTTETPNPTTTTTSPQPRFQIALSFY